MLIAHLVPTSSSKPIQWNFSNAEEAAASCTGPRSPGPYGNASLRDVEDGRTAVYTARPKGERTRREVLFANGLPREHAGGDVVVFGHVKKSVEGMVGPAGHPAQVHLPRPQARPQLPHGHVHGNVRRGAVDPGRRRKVVSPRTL